MITDKLPDILTVRELADYFKIHEATVKRAIKSGKLKAFKATRDWRVSKEAVIQWLEAKKE